MKVLAAILLLCALPAAHALCDLTGRWSGFYGPKGLHDNYYITQSGNTLEITCLSDDTPDAVSNSSSCGWNNGTATLSCSSDTICAVTMSLNPPTQLTGTLNCSNTDCGWIQDYPACPFSANDCKNIGRFPNKDNACATIFWDNKSQWIRVPTVKKVHLVWMNHLDVGYDGIYPETGYINNILNIYFHQYFPRAIEIANTLRDLQSPRRFIYTTHPWLVWLYVNCPANLVLAGIKLVCPFPEELANFEAAIRRGDIVWHRGPFNLQPENMDASLFSYGLTLAEDLAVRYNVSVPRTLSQRDVPGMSRGVVPLLKAAGAQAISVGVNGGTCPPLVPKAFVWQDVESSQEVIGLWHPYGYPNNPGSPTDPQGMSRGDCVTIDGLDEVLCWPFRTDNSGPPLDINEVFGHYDTAQAQFPGAEVVASTFDAFVDVVQTVKDTLEVFTGEIGDVWLQGISSDPLKMAQYRLFARARTSCIKSGACDANDPVIKNSSLFLIKPPEHTWGLPAIPDGDCNNKWSNDDFHPLRTTATYNMCTVGWQEQRDFIGYALQALGSHPLANQVRAALSTLTPSWPSLSGFTPVSPQGPIKAGAFTLAFDSSGAIVSLVDSKGQEWASPSSPLGRFVYTTFRQEDYGATCSGVLGGKPNMDSAHPESSSYLPQLVGAWTMTNGGQTVVLTHATMPAETVSTFGAPTDVWAQLTFSAAAPGHIDMELQWFNKTTTRLAESFMYEFLPAPRPGYSWMMNKLGSWVSPLDVVWGGSQLQHGVWDGIRYQGLGGQPVLSVASLDVPVVAPATAATAPTPLVPFVSPLQGPVQGFGFNLYNNVWNTNYIFWYPFADGDQDERFHFSVDVTYQ